MIPGSVVAAGLQQSHSQRIGRSYLRLCTAASCRACSRLGSTRLEK